MWLIEVSLKILPCFNAFFFKCNARIILWKQGLKENTHTHKKKRNILIYYWCFVFVFRHIRKGGIQNQLPDAIETSASLESHWRCKKRNIRFWSQKQEIWGLYFSMNIQPAKSLKTLTGGVYFCLIGTQNTMPSCQEYTPPDSFFSHFAGWVNLRITILCA